MNGLTSCLLVALTLGPILIASEPNGSRGIAAPVGKQNSQAPARVDSPAVARGTNAPTPSIILKSGTLKGVGASRPVRGQDAPAPSKAGLIGRSAGESLIPSALKFERHVVDTAINALGADVGDKGPSGLLDIYACHPNGIYWYADGKKHVVDEFDTPHLFIHLRSADFDRDGDTDLVAADHANGHVVIYQNPGNVPAKNERWNRVVVDDQIRGAHAIALGDVNQDGFMDIAASGEAEAQIPDTLFWFTNPGKKVDRKWSKNKIGQSGGLAHYPAIGDVNGDGRPDVVHAAKKGEWFRAYYQPRKPGGNWDLQTIGEKYIQATNIQIGDLNGDGKPDLAATQGHHYGVLWFEAPSWKPHSIDQGLFSPHTLVVADLDRDGDLDLATCAYESKVLCWFANDGKGKFERNDISLDQSAYDLVARDVDGDGDLDLVVAGQNSKNVCWYEQIGKPQPLK